MSKELTTISPEGLEVANCYLQFGNIRAVSDMMQVPENKVVDFLAQKDVKRYIDTVYLDLGYRNRNNIGNLLDEMIESKLEEARESGMFSSKDLADLLQMAHKMRMDEINAQAKMESAGALKQQTNIQVNNEGGVPFGSGNYGKLMEKLLKDDD